MIRSSVHDAALRYAELGYPVFPCAPGDKTPLTAHGYKDATTDPEQIDRWWTERPASNIGIPTEGLLVLDVDIESHWLADDPEKLHDLTHAPQAITPSGGRHYLFRQPVGRTWRSTQSEIAPHIDTRANGGLFVAPPSALPDQHFYRWLEDCDLDVPPHQLPEPPPWLTEILDRLPATGTGSGVPSCAIANVIPDGQRNGVLAKLAGTMRRVGMSPGEIQAAMLKVNSDRCRPPLDPREVCRIAESIGRYEPDQISVALIENHWEQMLARETPREFQFTAISSAELAMNEYSLEYLIDGVLVRGQPTVIAGPKKTLKTNISIDLALALGQAGLFLGKLNVPQAVRVGVMSGESGAATIQETARRIAWAKNWALENFTGVYWSFDVPQLNNHKHIEALKRFIGDYELEVLLLDPTYLMMLGLGQDAGNLFVVGQYLKSIGDLAQSTGCTPILCHHLKKSINEPYEPAELENIAWAGFQEFVRQWILLNRRVKYDPENGGHHELWMSVGGSAGHSGLWGVNIEEGTRQDAGGRRWEVELLSAGEAYAARAATERQLKERHHEQQKVQQYQKYRDALWRALQRYPAGESMTALRRESKLNPDNFQIAMDELLDEGRAEVCTFTKGRRTLEGYRCVPLPDQADQTRPEGLFG